LEDGELKSGYSVAALYQDEQSGAGEEETGEVVADQLIDGEWKKPVLPRNLEEGIDKEAQRVYVHSKPIADGSNSERERPSERRWIQGHT
jgi:hypothetical protein